MPENSKEKQILSKYGLEIERKYIIAIPDLSIISKEQDYTKSNITQIYLEAPKGDTHRVRRREYKSETEYTETVKHRLSALVATERERTISEEEYYSLAGKMDRSTSPIIKTRHTFSYLGQTFEVDIYPAWKNSCIMETELRDQSEVVAMPPFIKILREVTGEKAYSNASMAKSFPEETLP